jgi:hypothetical protein
MLAHGSRSAYGVADPLLYAATSASMKIVGTGSPTRFSKSAHACSP